MNKSYKPAYMTVPVEADIGMYTEQQMNELVVQCVNCHAYIKKEHAMCPYCFGTTFKPFDEKSTTRFAHVVRCVDCNSLWPSSHTQCDNCQSGNLVTIEG